MIRAHLRFLVLVVLCTMFATPTTIFAPRVLAAPAQSNVERELRAIYKKIEKAYLRRDANSILALSAPNLKHREQGHTMSRAEVADSLRHTMRITSSINTVKVTILGVKIFGTKAVVSSRARLEMTMISTDGHGARLLTSTAGRDTWVRTARGWRLQFSDIQNRKTTINGKKIESGD